MKTTVDISDVLFERARVAAKEQGTTLRALIEAGLTRVLAASEAPPKRRKMRDLSFGGPPNSVEIPVHLLRSNREFIVVDGELVKVKT
jgi:succinylarginine dihydrolase